MPIIQPVISGPDSEGYYTVAGVEGRHTLAGATRVREQILAGLEEQAENTIAAHVQLDSAINIDINAVADGEYLQRVGNTFVGGPGGGGRRGAHQARR
jgi:hypothetical protein